ncbi:MAG: FAD-binding protein [Acidobacteriota bacterium]
MKYHQVIVVGGGLAGMRAALEAAKLCDTAVISKVHPLRSHSVSAQGGINAPLGNNPEGKDDSVERHSFDTVKGSDFLADQDAVDVFIGSSADRVYEMEHWGVPFSRTEDGRIAQRPFGGAGFPRTCYCADTTGHVMLHCMYERAIRHDIKFYEEWQVICLVNDGGACRGVIAISIITGELEAFMADAVIFGTGGAGRTYGKSTNAIINTGSGMAVAYWAGVPLKDMEFIQFHPTSIIGTNILMTEGARGEGGYLVNNRGERFMKNYTPKFMELAPRDIVARSIQTEINEGRGFENQHVHLDLRHLGKAKIMERLPGIRDICLHFLGIDPIDTPIPIQPAQHYTMGGIDCNINCETVLKGFYAAGECACVSVHGSNRLGGNSLLETIVFGKIAGDFASRYAKGLSATGQGKAAMKKALKEQEEKINRLLASTGSENPAKIRAELKSVMFENVGIFRDTKPMQEAVAKVRELRERYKKISLDFKGRRYNLDLCRNLELEGKIDLAEAIAAGALARTESRGSHFHLGYPKRDDDNWLKHTMATHTKDGPKLSYSTVTITKYKPEERKY